MAAKLGDTHEEEWGQPRAWMLARSTLGAIGKAAGNGWGELLADIFAESPYLDFLVHVLRDETFAHGVFGGRPRAHDTITTREEYIMMRDALVARIRALGIAGIIGQRRSASILYAWSQSGLREETVVAVADYVSGDKVRMVEAARALLGRSRDEQGSRASLHPDGLASVFDDVPAVLERLKAMADGGDTSAAQVTRAVTSALEFDNGTVEDWITRERERRSTTAPEEAQPHQ